MKIVTYTEGVQKQVIPFDFFNRREQFGQSKR
jgi:hypothetical protein